MQGLYQYLIDILIFACKIGASGGSFCRPLYMKMHEEGASEGRHGKDGEYEQRYKKKRFVGM